MSQLDLFRLDGRVALVPGGGGAIGSAMAAAFAGAGAHVVIVDQTDERAEAAAGPIRAAGAQVLALGADVTSEAECERIVAATVAEFGRLDIIINAVGGGAGKVLFDAEAYPRDAWDWIYEINVRSTLVRDPGRREGDDRGWARRPCPQHLVGPRVARHQRGLLGLRRGQGRRQLAHPPVGHRVGQARHHRQCDRPDLRRHAAGGDAPRRSRRSRPTSSAGSRSDASAGPTT